LPDTPMTGSRCPAPAGCAAGDRHPGAPSGREPAPEDVARREAGARVRRPAGSRHPEVTSDVRYTTWRRRRLRPGR
jgi:hypothetical protein